MLDGDLIINTGAKDLSDDECVLAGIQVFIQTETNKERSDILLLTRGLFTALILDGGRTFTSHSLECQEQEVTCKE